MEESRSFSPVHVVDDSPQATRTGVKSAWDLGSGPGHFRGSSLASRSLASSRLISLCTSVTSSGGSTTGCPRLVTHGPEHRVLNKGFWQQIRNSLTAMRSQRNAVEFLSDPVADLADTKIPSSTRSEKTTVGRYLPPMEHAIPRGPAPEHRGPRYAKQLAAASCVDRACDLLRTEVEDDEWVTKRLPPELAAAPGGWLAPAEPKGHRPVNRRPPQKMIGAVRPVSMGGGTPEEQMASCGHGNSSTRVLLPTP